MGLVGVVGFAWLSGPGPALKLVALSPIRTVTDLSFAVIPLFLLMGAFTTASGMSRELYRASNAWLGHLPGGLAMATIAACAGFGAICGSSVATAATFTTVALPEMRRFGYSDKLATGVIAAGGTLAILIPPSVILAIYGLLTDQDIGKLFIAGILPGLVATALYMLTIQAQGWLKPGLYPKGKRASWKERRASLRDIWAVAMLFLFVIGGLYVGIFTPTEGAGMGAGGAYLIAVARRRLGFQQTVDCLVQTLRTTAAIFTILIGALLFGYFLTLTQTPQRLTEALIGLNIGAYPILFLLMGIYLILGCILDAMAMVILTVPIVFPLITGLGFDPIWFGVIMVMVVELALITPPVGMNVYVIKGVAKDVSLGTIFTGVAPFILADVIRLGILVAFPAITLLLPTWMG
jgi:tripartite ATP-independent transporter DctM subunit